MTFKEIYEKSELIGCLTFATMNEESPETRIAHFTAYDDDGLYFTTMITKPFYRQLKNGKVSVCGLAANNTVTRDAEGMPIFTAGYFLRLSGEVKEVSIEELKQKNNPIFEATIKDAARYPATVPFCLYKGKGEIYDYDFEKEHRDHKLERERFAFGGGSFVPAGLVITDACIGCGACKNICSFSAIEEGNPYKILSNRCDECGSCFINCPANAILHCGKQN